MPIDDAVPAIDPVIEPKDDPALQTKLDALVRKDIGQPVTYEVQTKREIPSLALVIDAKGLYSLVVSWQERQVAGGSDLNGIVFGNTTIPDDALSSEVKTAIDTIFAAAIAAI